MLLVDVSGNARVEEHEGGEDPYQLSMLWLPHLADRAFCAVKGPVAQIYT